MVFVACSGFPVPVSRYWGELPAVEISDTEISIPGQGTVRRWLREAPDGFAFTLLAPKIIADGGFKLGAAEQQALEQIAELAWTLKARAVVFSAPELKHTPANRKAVSAFLKKVPAGFPTLVLDFPGWKVDRVAALGDGDRVVAAYDPLAEQPPAAGEVAYLRLPGPAGHRSRYDEASIEQLLKHCKELEPTPVFCVFRNIDMHTNARQLLELLQKSQREEPESSPRSSASAKQKTPSTKSSATTKSRSRKNDHKQTKREIPKPRKAPSGKGSPR